MESSYNICTKDCEKCKERAKQLESLEDVMYSSCIHNRSRCTIFRAYEYLCDPCRSQNETLNFLRQSKCH